MNTQWMPYLRYALEMCMLFPALCFALVPAQPFSRMARWKLWLLAIAEALAVAVCGTWICVRYEILSAPILLVSLILFFPSLLLSVRLSLPKVVFCLINAVLMVVMANYYTTFLSAPWEADAELTFSPFSSGICILIAFTLFLVALPNLRRRIPALFEDEGLDRIWLLVVLGELILSVLFLWMLPDNLSELLEGRRRLITLVAFPLIPLGLFLLYYLLWWIHKRLLETTVVEQENSLLRMENKRYDELSRYMDETRVLRHDYRQHMHVMSELAHRSEFDELTAYLDTLEQEPFDHRRFCANASVDAIAAHYTRLAEEQDTVVDWTLELPESLPMKESELCAMLGNLLDNSLRAVQALSPEQRSIRVILRTLSDQMLGLSVENPYSGKVRMGNDGFPVRRQKDHGIGLRSVEATVKKYNGTMEIGTENGFFSVNILLYPHPEK